MKISLFSDFWSNVPAHIEGDWSVIPALLGATHKPVDLPAPLEECSKDALALVKKGTPAFSPAEYPEDTVRAKHHVVRVWLLCFDLDDCSQVALQVALEKLTSMGIRFASYTSFSHRHPPHPASPVKARVILDIDMPVLAEKWDDFWLRSVRWFEEAFEVKVDRSCRDASRIYGLPYSPVPEEGAILIMDGAPLSVAGLMALPPLEEASTFLAQFAEDVPEADTALEVHKRRERAQKYLRKLPGAVEGQGGDQQTLKAAFAGPAFGLTADQFWPLLLQYNGKCDPPWDAGDLRAKLENAYRYNDRPFGYLLNAVPPPAPAATLSPQGSAAGAGPGVDINAATGVDPDSEGETTFLSSANEADLALHYIENNGGHEGHLASLGSELFVYDPEKGWWQHKSHKRLESEIFRTYHNARIYTDDADYKVLKITKTKIQSTASLVLRDYDVLDEDFLLRVVPGIAFKNIFAYAERGGVKFTEHSPKHKATWGVDYDLDPDQKPEIFLEMLHNLFGTDEDCEEKITALRQWIGAMLLGIAPQYARALVLQGYGSTGKSTLMEVIEGLLPKDVCGSIKPHEWGEDYKRAKLQGIRLNSVGEIPERDILASDYFKQVITGEITTARAPYGEPFAYIPQAGHVFSCNALPGTLDNTTGFWRRVMVIPFTKTFEGVQRTGTKADFVQRALSQAPGIYAWALEGADALIKAREYTLPTSHRVALSEWRQGTDSVTDFVMSCCDVTPSNEDLFTTSLGDLHKFFRRWAMATGRKVMGVRQLASRLRQIEGVREVTRNRQGVRFALRVRKISEWEDFVDPSLAL